MSGHPRSLGESMDSFQNGVHCITLQNTKYQCPRETPSFPDRSSPPYSIQQQHLTPSEQHQHLTQVSVDSGIVCSVPMDLKNIDHEQCQLAFSEILFDLSMSSHCRQHWRKNCPQGTMYACRPSPKWARKEHFSLCKGGACLCLSCFEVST